jgi:hypothetical protein
MNLITITHLHDFTYIFTDAIFIANNTSQLNKEIENNMWALSFESTFMQSIEIDDLTFFVSKLLEKRSEQLFHIDLNLSAIFYLWFDAQASQLRFNIVSNKHDKLPFDCHINIVHSPRDILEEAITDLTAPKKDIIMYDYSSEENDGADDEDDDNFTLNVYVERIPLPMQ